MVKFGVHNVYHYLLFTLFSLLVLYPLLTSFLLWRALLDVFLMLTLISSVVAAATNRAQLILSIVLAVLVIVPTWYNHYFPSQDIEIIGLLAGCIFFPYISLLLLIDIFMHKTKVSLEMIYGAVSIYLLIGLSFAFLYSLIFLLFDNAFQFFSMVPSEALAEIDFHQFVYFSFVTMTTLGYGDIIPIIPQVSAFVYMQAVIGQVYLTVLVARLVGLHISQARRDT